MNLKDISTQLLFTTTPVWVDRSDSRQSVGTGFILSIPVPNQKDQQIPLLVTNYHVVQKARRGLVELVERVSDGPKQGSRVRIEIPGEVLTRHIDQVNDLTVIPIGGILNQLESAGKSVFFRSISPDLAPSKEVIDELSALEEITFIGYPSGLYDEHNVTPIIRRGITATPAWNDFQGKPAFLIDAGVFPGSSGSPVFILNQGAYATRSGITIGNRVLFLGLLSEAILRKEAQLPEVFLGIGKVIKSHVLLQFAHSITAQLL